jgi:glucan phosphoethanolaminetransferase (alkaline phosphatase superfamily)
MLIEKIIDHLAQSSGAYCFYIGTIIISLQHLRQRRRTIATLVFIVGVLWLAAYASTVGFISQLGVDSFHEAQAFELKEALFWAKTLASQVTFVFNVKTFALYSSLAIVCILTSSFVFSLFKTKKKTRSYLEFSIASVFILIALYQTFWSALEVFQKNTQAYENIAANFSSEPPKSKLTRNLNVLLYIGESTSVINMSLYGYHRKTTPQLDSYFISDESFIKFRNVFSTHTHTSPSLLEALSIGRDRSDDSLPIDRRRRVSVVEVLSQAAVKTELLSNQGQAGTWNMASSIIFKNAARKKFSSESRYFGNADYKTEKPWDHVFFLENVKAGDLDQKSSTLLVFHSYAGHGGYLQNIPPPFRRPVDLRYSRFGQLALTGRIHSLRSIEEYDSAIKYIDFAVSAAIERIKGSKKPWVFIYFADHGDAVFPDRGHDSSRFIHEMVRVPFIIYFNSAAKKAYPDLFRKYTTLAEGSHTATLAQLPSTLFDLFGVSFDESVPIQPVIGLLSEPPPIVVRETAEGITAVNLSSRQLPKMLVDKSDAPTQHFVASTRYAHLGPRICYHRSNTIAKAIRGSLVANCLEIDIVIDEGGAVLAYHPPAENTRLTLEDVFSVVQSNKRLSFWLDGKNLDDGKSCDALEEFLSSQKNRHPTIVVEFPGGSHRAAAKVSSCIGRLKSLESIHPSYYVPTAYAASCSAGLAVGKSFEDVEACNLLKADLAAMNSTGIFTDISFDFDGIRAIEALPIASRFSWNTWNVRASQLEELSPLRFRMIILINDDPNNM